MGRVFLSLLPAVFLVWAMRAGQTIQPPVTSPKVVSRVEPEFTAEARAAKTQGTVLLRLVVDKNGTPQRITIASHLPHGLDAKAVEAVQRWRFEPAKQDGKPMDAVVTVEIHFRLFPDSLDKRAQRKERDHLRYNDAVSYLTDSVSTADPSRSFQKLLALAQSGYPAAQHTVASLYAAGEGVAKDDAQAIKWYRKAAHGHIPEAQYSLGTFYENGRGVKQDYTEAVQWYSRSAEQGYAEALYRLSVLFELGKGVNKNRVQALLFSMLAAKRDFKPALGRIPALESAMSVDEILEARELAENWKPGTQRN